MKARDFGLDEAARAAALREAEACAEALFEAVAATLIRPGVTETGLSREIFQLARRDFGIERHWHKRVVRAGPNTLAMYPENPPDRTIEPDDIVFVDLGPVIGLWEADFGRSYVLGSDPERHRLVGDLAPAFAAGKSYFESHPDVTGAELYAYAGQLAAAAGWSFGGAIAGHMIGEFPHRYIPGERRETYISPENTTRLREPDALGRVRHWILEIHFVDRNRGFGGFHEALISVG